MIKIDICILDMYYKRNKHIKLYYQNYQNHDRQALQVTTTATTTAVKIAMMMAVVNGNDGGVCEW